MLVTPLPIVTLVRFVNMKKPEIVVTPLVLGLHSGGQRQQEQQTQSYGSLHRMPPFPDEP
jgi:hypothetical protein